MNRHPVARAWRALMTSALLIVFAAVLAAAFAPVAPAQSAQTQAGTQATDAQSAARATKSASRYYATIVDARRAAKALLAQTGSPSLSVALVSNGRVVWRQGFGYADKATGTRPGPTTMYGIGSVSKMLATVAAMQLVDDGLVSLDEPFATYVPSFTMQSPGYRRVTVRMLLDHSSGFPGSYYADLLTAEFWPGYLQKSIDTLAQSRLKHTPGFLSVYCNDGFTMIEALVQSVTGKTYAQYVQDEIFTPLGMTHSAYPLAPFADDTYAKAYTGDTVKPREVLNMLASGGLYSTPTDLGKLATMFSNGGAYGGTRILSAASVAEMGTDQTLGSFDPAPSGMTRYGLGWDSVTQPGLKAVGVKAWVKGGDSIDYHAGFVVAPKQKLAAIVTGVTPATSGTCETLCERILLHALIDRGALRRMPARIPAVAPKVKKATQTQLAGMLGYWTGNGTTMRFSASPGDSQALSTSVLSGGTWTTIGGNLRLRTDGRFHAKGSATGMWTIRAGGRRYLVQRAISGYGHYRDDMLMTQKLVPDEPISAAWQARVGKYWLAASGQPDSMTFTQGGVALLTVGVVPGLNGYVTITSGMSGTQVVDPSENDDDALMFLQIPGFGSRDLNDAVVEDHAGEEWIRYGGTVFRPVDGVTALPQGPTTVTFGAEGHVEWRSLAEASSLTIGAGTAWRLYDKDMNVLGGGTTFPATTEAPVGSYLALFGPASSSTTVTVVPANAGQSTRPPAQSTKHFAIPTPQAPVDSLEALAAPLK